MKKNAKYGILAANFSSKKGQFVASQDLIKIFKRDILDQMAKKMPSSLKRADQ